MAGFEVTLYGRIWVTPKVQVFLAALILAELLLKQQTITLFGTVSNSATSRISKNGRKYTAFGVAIISDRNLRAFHYNVVAFGKQGHFAKPLQTGTRIKLVVQAQSQPDNIATLPLLTATFVRPVRPVAREGNA
jgi:hypothetical protein